MKKLQNIANVLKNFRTKVLVPAMNSDVVTNSYISLSQSKLEKKGETASGQRLVTNKGQRQGTGGYSLRTQRIKQLEGQQYRFVTLKDTKDFYQSFAAKCTPVAFTISANFQKENGNIAENFSFMYDKNQFIWEVLSLQIQQYQIFRSVVFQAVKKQFNEVL